MRIARVLVFLAAAGLPSMAGAQQDPTERIEAVLPASIKEAVLDRIASARSRDLPENAMANLALEGVAKGRSGEEVLAAVELLASDMGRAQEALQAAGRRPDEGEIEAATAAMRMGVDGSSISELARSGPSGRSLRVPLLVLGGLTERGLPSDDALAAVRDRLAARASDADLLREVPEIGGGRGGRPEGAGPALATGLAGFRVPASDVTVPVGPPNHLGRPAGRGRGAPNN